MPKNIIQLSYIGGTASEFEKTAELIIELKIPTKLNHIKTEDKLTEAIEKNQCRLIIGGSKIKGFDIFSAVKLANNLESNIPLIGTYIDPEISIGEAMNQGLNDYVNVKEHLHLQLVIKRELQALDAQAVQSVVKNTIDKDFTGLYSRMQFLDSLEKERSARIKASNFVSLVYLQLDNFSWINESIGLMSGDSFLKSTAKVISNILDGNDIAARYQGGSFILLVSAESLAKLTAKADMLREAITTASTEIGEEIISSSCSIGIRVLIDSDESIQTAISESFEASDKAKSNGGDTVHLFKNLDNDGIDRSAHAWDERIQDAFENDLFQLYYQPIVSLRGDTKPRYEVLLRLIDEDGNIISPGNFLPSAERAGLMADIDRRVIVQSFEKAVEEKEKGNSTEIFIKLSGKSLDDKTMSSWITKTIKKYDFDNADIVFEITESLALSHLPQTRRMVDNLKKLNCKIVIDHFGTRLKSLKLLGLVAIDYIKIDGGLLGNLSKSKSHQVIVKNIFKEAKKHDIEMMATTIQDVNMLPVVWQYGFHYVQGYFLQIPDEEMLYDFSNLLV